MFPTIDKKETGVNLRRIMDMRGVKPKDIQEYLGFGCVQSVYRWLDGVSVPTVDNLYAISKMLQVQGCSYGEKMENPEERLLLKYRYLKNESWEDISYELNVSYRTVHRIHASALNNFVVPE